MPQREVSEIATDVIGARILAQLVDLTVQFGLCLTIAVAGGIGIAVSKPGALVLVMSVPLVYNVVLEWFWDGQTLGKRLLGIKVVDHSGQSPGLVQVIFRNLPAIVIFSWVAVAVGLASMAMSDRNQRLFDRFAYTFVVHGTFGGSKSA